MRAGVRAQRRKAHVDFAVREHAPVQQRRMPDEARDLGGRRALVQVARGAGLEHAAAVDDRDAVGHAQRLVLVVRDEQRRRTAGALQCANLVAQLMTDAGIERRQRLVEQQQLRFDHERPRERDALLLPAGQHRDAARRMRRQSDPLEHVQRAPAPHVGRDAAHPQPVRDVVEHRQVREQRVVLEHHPHFAPPHGHAGHVVAADRDAAAPAVEQPGREPQQRGFTGPAAPHHREQFALRGGQRDVVDAMAGARILKADVFEFEAH